MLVNASYLLFFHADTLVLGYLLGPESIGAYQVAKQFSQLGLFAMVAVQFVFSPRIAALVAAHDWASLKALYKVTILIGGSFSASVLVMFSLLGESVVAYFGPAFGDAWLIAMVMLTSQVVISLLGPIGTLASMGGQARVVWLTYLGGGLLLLGVGPQVVERWGLLGAAVAHAVTATSCVLVIGARITRSMPICGARHRLSREVPTTVSSPPPT
jgi:O-antigen/teichoic acid export membrane protein